MSFRLQPVIFLLVIIFMITSCSSSEEQEEAGIIEQTTDQIAQEAVKAIKTPIEQAKLARELQESHNAQVQEAIDKQ